jgi:hypothetical protein
MGQVCCKDSTTGEISAQQAAEIQSQANAEKATTLTPTAPAVAMTVADTTGSANVMKINVTRENKDTKWGLVWCENDSEPSTLRVKCIRAGQAFATYNANAADDQQVEPGDRIVAVNQVVMGGSDPSNPQEGFSLMRNELQKSTSVELKVVKYPRNFAVEFSRGTESFGLELQGQHSPLVSRIVLDGAVDEQNQSFRTAGQLEKVLHEGMVVISVNGKADPKEFASLLATETKVSLEMERFNPNYTLS